MALSLRRANAVKDALVCEGEETDGCRSPDTTKPPGGGFAPTTVDPLRAAIRRCRSDPGGGYCEGRRRRDGELHV